MNRRYLIVAVLLVILVADLGWKAWNDRPYIVTGRTADASPNSLVLYYTLPGGGEGRWEMAPNQIACWMQARLGERVPDCIYNK